jgi:cytochrome c biogenesis protein CcmG, thiol:disulfide interchange protein DsbE
MLRYLIPLGLFLVLVVFLAIGLTRGGDRDKLPSALIDKPAPVFSLPQLKAPAKTFSAADMRGKVWLMNVWASWCAACRDEHPYLSGYAKTVPIIGLNYKDKPEDALSWLGELGDPYVLSAVDLDGRVAIDYGVYGAPETYVIDKNGTIRLKHVGPIMPDVWDEKILPLVQELNRQ